MTRDANHSVKLSSDASPAITSHLRAWVDEKGLVIEGQDLGPGVSAVWGDSDYEYWLRIERKDFVQLITSLALKLDVNVEASSDLSERDKLVLKLLQSSWSKGLFETDVDFRRWLNAIHVPSQFSSYA